MSDATLPAVIETPKSSDRFVPVAFDRGAPLITEPGFYPDITPVQYFAEPCPEAALSNSGVTILNEETPYDFAYQHPALNPDPAIRESSVAMRTGDLVHQLALGKGKGYRVGQWDEWRTNEAKAFRDTCLENGLVPVKPKDFDAAEIMASIVRERIARALQGADFHTELVFAWVEVVHVPDLNRAVRVWCRGMLDVWAHEIVTALDPKITAYLTNSRVRAHIQNMGWDNQAAFYMRGLSKLVPSAAGRIRFKDLMIKPKAPFTSRTVDISREWASSSEVEIDRALVTFARCMATNSWPGYADDGETLDPPPWLLKNRLEAMEMAAAVDDEEA